VLPSWSRWTPDLSPSSLFLFFCAQVSFVLTGVIASVLSLSSTPVSSLKPTPAVVQSSDVGFGLCRLMIFLPDFCVSPGSLARPGFPASRSGATRGHSSRSFSRFHTRGHSSRSFSRFHSCSRVEVWSQVFPLEFFIYASGFIMSRFAFHWQLCPARA
jgi:hypothetical protein